MKIRTTVRSLATALIAVVAALAIAGTALAHTDGAAKPKPCVKTKAHRCKKPKKKPAKPPAAAQATCLTIAPVAWMNQQTGLGLTGVDFRDYSKIRAKTLTSNCSYKNAEYHGEASAMNFSFYDKKSVQPAPAEVWKMISAAWQKAADQAPKYHPTECGPSAPTPLPSYCTLKHPFGAYSVEIGPQIFVFKHGYAFNFTSPDSLPLPVLERVAAAIIARY